MQRRELVQMRAIPLATKALCSPYPYDTAYEVHVQLDEPLWSPRSGSKVVAMDIMGLCVQLDTIILTSSLKEDSSQSDPNRRVSFEKGLGNKAAGVLQQMRECLRRAGMDDDVEDYLRTSGIGYLFPRVELYLQEPDQELVRINSSIMDGYFSYLGSLNNVLALAQQMNTDVITSPSHKYIAHQIALLYQCVSHIPQFSQLKKDIEGKFSVIKTACSPQASGHPPRLPADLQAWLVSITQKLMTLTSSLSDNDLLSHNTQAAEVISTLRTDQTI